jgi:Recombination endonuclease VII
MTTPAYPKPKDSPRKIQAVRKFTDGREVCQDTAEGRDEYQRRKTLMWSRQGNACCICHKPIRLAQATFEHEHGRGAGGSKRDDRIVLPHGQWINGAACWPCNSAKGSQKGSYNK